jgi:hypothetical protein
MTKLLISLGANTNTTAYWSLEEQKLFLGHIQCINSQCREYRRGTAVVFATVLKGINNDRFSNDEMNYLVEFVTEEVRTIEPK